MSSNFFFIFFAIHQKVNEPLFGPMTRYHQLDLNKIDKTRMQGHASAKDYFDAVVQRVNAKWSRLDHNIVTNNCHHHVADVLNELQYDGRSDWGQVDVAWLAIVKGQRVK